MNTIEDTNNDVESYSRMNIIKYNVHTAYQNLPPKKIEDISHKLALPVHLMLLNLDGNMNIAMSIRTAAVFGCSDVWIVGKRKYDARPEVGSKNYIRVHKIDYLDDPSAFFKRENLQPILIEQGGQPLEEINFKSLFFANINPNQLKHVCFIFGSESHGINKTWLEIMKDEPRISISQYGMIRSFNVSVACSIVLYEYFKQWRETRICV